MSSYDLCQLSDVKAWLNVGTQQTTNDTLLAGLITSVSYDFLREISRLDFYPSANYTEVREGDGGASMILRHWPLNEITSVTITVNSIPPVTTTIHASTDDVENGYWIDMDLDPEARWELFLDGCTFTDLATVTVAYNAGYAN